MNELQPMLALMIQSLSLDFSRPSDTQEQSK